MNKNDFLYLGKILKTHGNKGHLLVVLDADLSSQLPQPEAVFIGTGHDFIPFMVEELDLQVQNKAILKFDDVNSVSEAEQYTGMSLYLPAGSKYIENRDSDGEITGFTVMDEKLGNIGTVTSILDMPHQKLLQVNFREKEVLIPMAGGIIIKTDRKKKIIFVSVPEGLIEIYL
jgi:16S rRNA processing protein RimM